MATSRPVTSQGYVEAEGAAYARKRRCVDHHYSSCVAQDPPTHLDKASSQRCRGAATCGSLRVGAGEAARGGWQRLARGRRPSSGSHLSLRGFAIQGLRARIPHTYTHAIHSFSLSHVSSTVTRFLLTLPLTQFQVSFGLVLD